MCPFPLDSVPYQTDVSVAGFEWCADIVCNHKCAELDSGFKKWLQPAHIRENYNVTDVGDSLSSFVHSDLFPTSVA